MLAFSSLAVRRFVGHGPPYARKQPVKKTPNAHPDYRLSTNAHAHADVLFMARQTSFGRVS
jgi:hypothetical protein